VDGVVVELGFFSRWVGGVLFFYFKMVYKYKMFSGKKEV